MPIAAGEDFCRGLDGAKKGLCESLVAQCTKQRSEGAFSYRMDLGEGNSIAIPNFDRCVAYAKFRAGIPLSKPVIAREEPPRSDRGRVADPASGDLVRRGEARDAAAPQLDEKASEKCRDFIQEDSPAFRSCVEYLSPCFTIETGPFTLPFSRTQFATRERCLQFAIFHAKSTLKAAVVKPQPLPSSTPARTKKADAPHPLKKASEKGLIASFARLAFSLENSEDIKVENLTAPFISDDRTYAVKFTVAYYVEDLGNDKFRIHYMAVDGEKDEFTKEDLTEAADFSVDENKIAEDLAFEFTLEYEGNFTNTSSIEIVKI